LWPLVHGVFSSSCGEGEVGDLRAGIGLGDKLLERGLVERDGVSIPRRGDAGTGALRGRAVGAAATGCAVGAGFGPASAVGGAAFRSAAAACGAGWG
jgi:hypothetical protein